MSTERFGRNYGDSLLIGDTDDFFALSVEDQALALGWSEACPVAQRLCKHPKEGGRGPLTMRNRYGEINFWRKFIIETLLKSGESDPKKKEHHERLYQETFTSQARLVGEPLGKHDEGWLPEESEQRMFYGTPGYSIPRLLIWFIKRNEEKNLGNSAGVQVGLRQKETVTALGCFQRAAESSSSAIDFLVVFAKRLAEETKSEEEKKAILKHVLGRGKLEEENCFTEYRQIAKRMRKRAPELWQTYLKMTPEERLKGKIAEYPFYLQEHAQKALRLFWLQETKIDVNSGKTDEYYCSDAAESVINELVVNGSSIREIFARLMMESTADPKELWTIEQIYGYDDRRYFDFSHLGDKTNNMDAFARTLAVDILITEMALIDPTIEEEEERRVEQFEEE